MLAVSVYIFFFQEKTEAKVSNLERQLYKHDTFFSLHCKNNETMQNSLSVLSW